MASPEPRRNDIIMSDQEAQYVRNLERVRALSYRSADNDMPTDRRVPTKPAPTLDSGLQVNGSAANDTVLPANKGRRLGLGTIFGNATNDSQASPAERVANAAVNAAVPGSGLAALWNQDLPALLRLMVAGKEFSKPGGIMILWPILSLPYCFFGLGTLFFWMLQPRKGNGQEIKLADIKMGPIDMIVLAVTLGVWGMITLFFMAIFGGVSSGNSPIPFVK